MKLYYNFDLPNVKKIQEQILPNIPSFFFTRTVFQSFPKEQFDFLELREAVGLIKPWEEITHMALITTMPNAHLGAEQDTYIHMDVRSQTPHGLEQAVCLNIPIYNCDDTYVAYYESREPAYWTEAEYGNGVKFQAWHFKKDWCTEIDRVYLRQPALFYTQIPHGIINETQESRIILSVRFSTPIDLETFQFSS